MAKTDKIHVPNLRIVPKKEPELHGQLAEKTYSICELCEKRVGLYEMERSLCDKLTKDGHFYCTFCLRNHFDTRNNRDILIMSFRGILGYYYEYLYRDKGELSYSQIQDFVRYHKAAGLQNPIFYYDDESMLWFVDFARVGRGKKKMQMTDILKTTLSILSSFNLCQVVPDVNMHKMYDKYKEAIEKFAANRYRPDDRWLLIPTLHGCSSAGYPPASKKKFFDHEVSRDFNAHRLIMRR